LEAETRINRQQTKKSLWSTGAGKWINRANVTIDRQLQGESTVSTRPSTTDSVNVTIGKKEQEADSAIVVIRKNKQGQQ
jgi:hypothetical protein